MKMTVNEARQHDLPARVGREVADGLGLGRFHRTGGGADPGHAGEKTGSNESTKALHASVLPGYVFGAVSLWNRISSFLYSRVPRGLFS
jgi:hypothetical protein